MNNLRIDSHKLLFHPQRTAAWLHGECIAPIYMELSPSGACNHRCSFCGLDFMGYKARFLPTERTSAILTELGAMGLKSVMFAGEGEPLLHKGIVALTKAAKAAGVDVAFTTNAVLLDEKRTAPLLEASSWIKVSMNAGTRESYARIHGTKPEDFDRVLANLEAAVKLRQAEGFGCTLGAQILLLPEVAHEIVGLAKRCKEIGLDYLVVKPYSQHPQSHTRVHEQAMHISAQDLAEKLAAITGDGFTAIFRQNTLQKIHDGMRNYKRCLALPFWSYVDAGGEVWGCSVFLNDQRFSYGNILEQSFSDIWNGEKRRSSLAFVENDLDATICRVGCRMDEINRYLWELKHPGPHVNFI